MKPLHLLLAGCLLAACSSPVSQQLDLCIGTYGERIYRVSFEEGRFGEATALAATNASFLLPVGEGVLYSVSENDRRPGICSFRGDTLTAFNPEIGGSPCYVMQAEGHPFVLTADYNGGSISVFAVADGIIGERVQCVQYTGGGPFVGRQTQSHIHQLRTLPSALCRDCGIRGEWLLATDLGSDSIHVLRIHDTADGSPLLTDCPYLTFPLPAGSGPRHMEWNEAHRLLYCLTELSGEVLAWQLTADEAGQPVFTLCQRIEADDAHAAGSADIHLHPSGQYLYTSHRLQDDGITLFHVGDDGLLTRMGKTRTEGHPRHFFLTPDGSYLLVACRDGHCVQVFAIDPATGALTDTGERLSTATDGPVCVAQVP